MSPAKVAAAVTKGKDRNSSRGPSPSGKKARPPCPAYMQRGCNNPKCDKWHVPVCVFWKKGNCNAGKNCIFLHRELGPVGAPAKKAKGRSPKGGRSQSKKNKSKGRSPKGAKATVAIVESVKQGYGMPLLPVKEPEPVKPFSQTEPVEPAITNDQ